MNETKKLKVNPVATILFAKDQPCFRIRFACSLFSSWRLISQSIWSRGCSSWTVFRISIVFLDGWNVSTSRLLACRKHGPYKIKHKGEYNIARIVECKIDWDSALPWLINKSYGGAMFVFGYNMRYYSQRFYQPPCKMLFHRLACLWKPNLGIWW